jgi:hypothetical protein
MAMAKPANEVEKIQEVEKVQIRGRLTFAAKTTSPLLQPTFYDVYLAGSDKELKAQYADQWNYHEKQILYSATQWRGEYLALGTMNHFGRTPLESTVRQELATRILRQRTNYAVNTLITRANAPVGVRNAVRTLNQAKNVSLIAATTPNATRKELRMGYDTFTDSGKLEYIWGGVEIGIYNGRIMSSLFSGTFARNNLYRFAQDWGDLLPKTSITYRASDALVIAEVRQPISENIVGQIVAAQPCPGSAVASSWEARLIYAIRF